MSQIEKLINKFFSNSTVTNDDAKKILKHLGFSYKIEGSHQVFTKQNYTNNISLKIRKELLYYQKKEIKRVLIEHGYEKN